MHHAAEQTTVRPLLVSIAGLLLVEMQAFSDFAAEEGADFLVVAPP